MYEAGDEIDPKKLPEMFAKFFDNKIKDVLAQTSLEENIYNGYKKVNSESKFFMSKIPVWYTPKTALSFKDCMAHLYNIYR